ncbi:hypothetical protein [Thiothrix nivea]|uniref:Uncharacterized protein n=1 Tax=Thiothrix nivea (strain ATCC 35100 / DSM 5205 / JP2) TaxID=870187 RepID=A0A656HI40_THINJ|nr:hypothetical protein [Thiothrix nivea]EIJ35704.1 hypothetical protein Thini_3181 [Thiothrix nivea DSM 5205]
MFKYILSTALLMAVSVAAAESEPAKTTAATSSVMPVIVKNEPIGPQRCRLHFEDGNQKEVACDEADSGKS